MRNQGLTKELPLCGQLRFTPVALNGELVTEKIAGDKQRHAVSCGSRLLAVIDGAGLKDADQEFVDSTWYWSCDLCLVRRDISGFFFPPAKPVRTAGGICRRFRPLPCVQGLLERRDVWSGGDSDTGRMADKYIAPAKCIYTWQRVMKKMGHASCLGLRRASMTMPSTVKGIRLSGVWCCSGISSSPGGPLSSTSPGFNQPVI